MGDDKNHLYGPQDVQKDRKNTEKRRDQQQFSRFSSASSNNITSSLNEPKQPATQIENKVQIGDPYDDTKGVVGPSSQLVSFDIFGSNYTFYEVTGDVSFTFNELPVGRHITFTLDILVNQVAGVTLTFNGVTNPPVLAGNDGDRYVLTFVAVNRADEDGINPPTQTVTFINGATGGGSLPAGIAVNDHLEWDGAAWVAQQFLEFNATGPHADAGFLRFANDDIMLAARNISDNGNLELKVTDGDQFDFTESNNGTVTIQLRAQDAIDPDQILSITQLGGATGTAFINTPDLFEIRIAGNLELSVSPTIIDVQANSIRDIDFLQFEDASSIINHDAGGFTFDTPLGDNYEFQIDSVIEFEVSSSTIDVHDKSLNSYIGWVGDVGQADAVSGTGITHSLPTGDTYLWQINGISFLEVGVIDALNTIDIKGRRIKDIDFLQFEDASSLINHDAGGFTFETPLNDNYEFLIDSTLEFEITATKIDVYDKAIVQYIGWTAAVGQSHSVDSGGMAWNLPTGDVYDWLINGSFELSLSATQMNVFSKQIVNVTDPTSDQHAATKKYVDDNSGSQTPWTSDIDADGFSLTDLEDIQFRIANTTLASASIPYIQYFDTSIDQMVFNVPTGDQFTWRVNGVVEMTLTNTGILQMTGSIQMAGNDITSVDDILMSGTGSIIDMSGGDIIGVDRLEFANSTSQAIETSGGSMDFLVPTGDEFEMKINATNKFQVTASQNILYDTGGNSVTTFSSRFEPVVDNTIDLGSASFRWIEVFAVNGTINTSFSEYKENIREVDVDDMLALALEMKPIIFNWKHDNPKNMEPLPNELEFRQITNEEREPDPDRLAQNYLGYMGDPLIAMPEALRNGDGISQSSVEAVTLGAIQALYNKIDTLQARVDQLEGN